MWSNPDSFEWIAGLSHYTKNLPNPNSFCNFLAQKSLRLFDVNSIYLCALRRNHSLSILGFSDSDIDEISSDENIILARMNPVSEIDTKLELTGQFTSDSPIQLRFRTINTQLAEKYLYVMTLERLELRIGYVFFTFNDLKKKQNFSEHVIFLEILRNLTTAYLYGWQTHKKLESTQIQSKAKHITQRQRELIKFFPSKKTVDEMAGILGFSQSTIKKDLIEIYKFFGTKDRIEINDLAAISGLLN